MDRYLDPESDRVGTRLVKLVRDSSEPTTADFAQALVRAAATLGSERVVELLLGWIDGEPLNYRAEALLGGMTVDQPLELAEEGIRIEPLPRSSADLAASLPPTSEGLYSGISFWNGARLSIDCKAEPVLYKPSKSETGQPDLQLTWAQGRVPKDFPYMLCEALSLACNHCVRWALWWHDYGGLEEFNAAVGPVMFYADIPSRMTTTRLSEGHLKETSKIYLMRRASEEMRPRSRLDMAAGRWMKSKGSASLADQLIDLRIALEALYLEGEAGEIRFRLATYGAWHLGADAAERGKYHKTLRDAYDLSSKAVHAGAVEDTPENREKLTAAQDLCRQGILKRLFEEPPKPRWTELIMGAV